MHDLKAKVGHIRGLIEGLGLEKSPKEGKVLIRIVEVLEEITDSLLDLDESYADLAEYAETIDEDLTELEDNYYDEEDERHLFGEEEAQEGSFSFECPQCREIIYVDDSVLDEDEEMEILCPGCGEVVLISDGEESEKDLMERADSEDFPAEDIIVDENE